MELLSIRIQSSLPDKISEEFSPDAQMIHRTVIDIQKNPQRMPQLIVYADRILTKLQSETLVQHIRWGWVNGSVNSFHQFHLMFSRKSLFRIRIFLVSID